MDEFVFNPVPVFVEDDPNVLRDYLAREFQRLADHLNKVIKAEFDDHEERIAALE